MSLSVEDKEKMANFVKFVSKELELDETPTIVIKNNRDGLKTTANYDYTKENKIIKVCRKNRALVDVLRSIAHEMVHHKQFEQGRLEVKPPDIGGEIEDELEEMSDDEALVYLRVSLCLLLNIVQRYKSLLICQIFFIFFFIFCGPDGVRTRDYQF